MSIKNENRLGSELAEVYLKILDILFKEMNGQWQQQDDKTRGVVSLFPIRFISTEIFISKGIITEQLENFCEYLCNKTGIDLIGTLEITFSNLRTLDPDELKQRRQIKKNRLVVYADKNTQEKLRELLSELKTIAINSEVPRQVHRPFCCVEDKWGFLKFNKYDQGIKIGNATRSQPFKLLKCLIEPFGTAKPIDTVFEAIRENVKYKSKKGVFTKSIDRAQKVNLIGYAIKDLQKDNKLQGKLKVRWDELKTKYWLEYLQVE